MSTVLNYFNILVKDNKEIGCWDENGIFWKYIFILVKEN